MMRFHYGLGVGHVYSHNVRVIETPSPISTRTPAQTVDEHLETGGSLGKATQWQALADEEDDEDDHVGVEELDFFDHGLNASTESIIHALDEMFTIGHTLDYEN
jgi:hypothetical protein